MKLLSLDLSTYSTGYAIGTDAILQQHGCIIAKSKNVEQRIIQMRKQIVNLIINNKPNKIIIQQVRSQVSNHTNKVLMWLQGAIILVAYQCDPTIKIQFVNASEWRAAIKIHQGRGIKREQVKAHDIQYVKNKYNIDVNDDQADAICIFDSYWIKNQNNEINWQ